MYAGQCVSFHVSREALREISLSRIDSRSLSTQSVSKRAPVLRHRRATREVHCASALSARNGATATTEVPHSRFSQAAFIRHSYSRGLACSRYVALWRSSGSPPSAVSSRSVIGRLMVSLSSMAQPVAAARSLPASDLPDPAYPATSARVMVLVPNAVVTLYAPRDVSIQLGPV